MITPSRTPKATILIVALILAAFSAIVLLGAHSRGSINHQVVSHHDSAVSTTVPNVPKNQSNDGEVESLVAKSEELHVLLPASNPDVNLCKTLLTGAVLDYPTPTLIAWNQTFDQGHLLGGGSHVAKISGVLEYLNALDHAADQELVLMMDAYGAFNLYDNPSNVQAHLEADIWFQLRPEVLLSRYHSINQKANARLQKRLGSAVEAEDLQQTIIFGAGKRCAPNQVHTVACYPIPESPLPDDLYGSNTDTIMGRNKYTSLKQRYLNSGYIIGPVGDMRKMFQRAWDKVQATKDQMDWDNGSHGSDFMYHGSDQSIFNEILGEQEFQREVMRRRHRSRSDKIKGIAKKPKATHIEGTLIQDPLNPGFIHETMEHKDGKPDEFGIGLDYFSELGQQTVNAEEDARWIQHDSDLEEQTQDRHLFDCPSRLTADIPSDISSARSPVEGYAVKSASIPWKSTPLYTNLCLNTIPVMIHHNGDKGAREFAWPQLWLQKQARELMDGARRQSANKNEVGGAFSEGQLLEWSDLCPADMDIELYRDPVEV